MTRFDFEGAENWETSTDTYLPVGNFVVTILSAEGSKTNNENPQIELQLGNDQGTRKDWQVYAEENGVSKVATLFRIAGVELTNGDQEADGKLKEATVAKLVGKQVGVVIRDEASFKEPGKMVPRVRGYVPVDAIAEAQPAAASSNRDIPF